MKRLKQYGHMFSTKTRNVKMTFKGHATCFNALIYMSLSTAVLLFFLMCFLPIKTMALYAGQMILCSDQIDFYSDQMVLQSDQMVLHSDQMVQQLDQMVLHSDQMVVNLNQMVLYTDQMVLQSDQMALHSDQMDVNSNRMSLNTVLHQFTLYPADRIYDEDEFDSRGILFSYGVNAGAYFANDATANYYNGSGRNNLEETIMRQHTYNRIREILGYDFEFPGEPHEYLPQNMRYSPSMTVGVFGMLHFNRRISLHAEFNYARLRLQDQFMLRILKGDPGFIGDDIERFNITGSEERSDIKLGLQYIHRSARNEVHPYFEFGLNMINTKVRENRVQIAGSTHSILNLTDRRYGFRDDGISFGTYAGGGLRLDLGRSNALAIGALANYASINLGDYKNAYHMHYSFFIRLYLTAGSELSATD